MEANNKYLTLELTGMEPDSHDFVNYWHNIKLSNDFDISRRLSRKPTGLNLKNGLLHQAVTLSSGKKIEVILIGYGPPVLLIPGLGVTAPIWLNQIEKLSKDFMIIIIHLPGHGLSEVTEDLSYKGISFVLDEVLHQLGITVPVHVIGACIGGLVAVNLSVYFSSKISSLTLIGSILDWDTDIFNNTKVDRKKIKEFMCFLNQFDDRLTEEFQTFTQSSEYASLKIKKYYRNRVLQEKSKSIDPFAYLQYVLDISKNDNIKDILADLSCPVLLITGENDSVVDIRNSMRMNRIIKNSEYIAIPGAGHFSYVTHYEEFNHHVIDFMLCSERMVN